ncbi:hypothetical protein GGR54DRAFT_437965 [Hypoxylon sp. NC1633]|nr:hypothetical protein GGR54DRAFT_437965 [Hypoxylon sp. NC1633]
MQGEVQREIDTSEHSHLDKAAVDLDPLDPDPDSSSVDFVTGKAQLNEENMTETSMISEVLKAARSKAQSSPSRKTNLPLATQTNAPVRAIERINSPVKKIAQGHKRTGQDLDSYLENLFEKAITIQAEAEAKAMAAQKAAEETEWRKRIEENIRLKAEADLHEKFERARLDLEQERYAKEQKEAADDAFRKQALEEAKAKVEEVERRNLGKDKAPIRFKDAVGRKFSFPYHLSRTWQGIEELIKQAFIHVDVIGPHVQAGHYDLVGPTGDIILPQVWERVIEPDWQVTMHMWPMDIQQGRIAPARQGGGPAPEGPMPRGPLPKGSPPVRPPPVGPPPKGPSPGIYSIDVMVPKKKRNYIGSFFSKNVKRLTGRGRSTSSLSTSSSRSSFSDD